MVEEKAVKKKKRFYKKWWFWVIIGVVLLIIIGSSVSSSDDNTDDSHTSSDTKFKINDPVTVGDLTYTVIDVYDTDNIGYNNKTENNYVVVTLTVKNNGKDGITVYDSMFEYYRGDAKYECSANSIYLENGFYVLQAIGAGITKTISVAYEIPSEHEGTDCISVKASSYGKSEKIFMKK